jgi:hypothetical protein
MDVLKLYKALPQEVADEAQLDLFLRNAYKIPEYDLASLSGYRSVIYTARLLVLNEQGKMVKGPEPKPFTAEHQHELWREREETARAERDKYMSAQIEQALEPSRREFASQLQFHLGDRLGRIEMAIAELREQVASNDGSASSAA